MFFLYNFLDTTSTFTVQKPRADCTTTTWHVCAHMTEKEIGHPDQTHVRSGQTRFKHNGPMHNYVQIYLSFSHTLVVGKCKSATKFSLTAVWLGMVMTVPGFLHKPAQRKGDTPAIFFLPTLYFPVSRQAAISTSALFFWGGERERDVRHKSKVTICQMSTGMRCLCLLLL